MESSMKKGFYLLGAFIPHIPLLHLTACCSSSAAGSEHTKHTLPMIIKDINEDKCFKGDKYNFENNKSCNGGQDGELKASTSLGTSHPSHSSSSS